MLFTFLILPCCVLASFNPAHLFPVSVLSGFSTAPAAPALPNDTSIARLALSDVALGVTKLADGPPHNVVMAPNAPSDTLAWQADYPRGSYNPSFEPRGGFSFYLAPPSYNFSATDELLFSYAVYFPADFQWNKGGKLPGPYGGTSADEAYACSGGRQEDRANCFCLRLMWREDGAGEIYAYLPELAQNTAALSTLAGTVIDDAYGISVARGAFAFAAGAWTVVAQRVRLNTPGAADGELELWVNGESVIRAAGVTLRLDERSVFFGAHMQSFFGGSTSDWASPVDQQAFFADISAAAVASNSTTAGSTAAYPLASSTALKPYDVRSSVALLSLLALLVMHCIH